MLNWRRDPGYEQRMRETEIAILRERQKRLQIEQMKKEDELLEKEDEQLEKEDEQIENEIEQLRRENARLKTLLACVDQLCFPPVSSSSPPKSTETDCGPSSP
jgi:ATP-dependent 26S proteasome regulatory subunit